ncbi:hypothetical protein Tco_0901546 [Tanacetum coccineum]
MNSLRGWDTLWVIAWEVVSLKVLKRTMENVSKMDGHKNKVIGYGNGTSVVTKDGYHLVMNVIVTDLTFHPKNVCTAPVAATYSASAEDISTNGYPITVASCDECARKALEN